MKTKSQTFAASTLVTLALALAMPAGANTTKTTTTKTTTTDTVTAEQHGDTQSDVDVTQRIRERLTSDKALSIKAKNVLIVTNGDSVRLQGPVASKNESTLIESVAKEFAGARSVVNNLTVER